MAVLPGVTVEAASPALIEKVRSVTTDANGAYRIGIRDLPGGNVRAFQSIERQDYVVKLVVDWFDQTFPPAGSTAAPERLARARGTVRG